MAAMTMDREPEVARFIDTYKFDQEMSTRRDRFGGGTSLPLHSDGYEDKQRSLRDERHRDWLGQQEKPRDPVYYRVGTPEQGFPGLGNYSKQRQENNKMRQKEYNAILKKQKQLEQQKIEARRRSPPRPAQPQGPQIDYNLAGQQAKAEEKRAYQDYMGKYQYTANAPPKPTFDYEENKKVLNEERKREYNQLMEKKAKEEQYWQMRGRPVTPPGGLNIGNYDRQLKETAAAKKKEYKEMLDQQQKEHMYLRARQEPEMAVIDRNAPPQHLANKPPAGPGYNRSRDENEEKRRYEEEKHHQQISKPAEVVKNQYYSSDDYEKFQKEIQRKQGEEYRDFLAKKAGETRNRDWNFEQSGVLELHGDEAVQSKQRALRAERQKEYNSYISQRKRELRNPYDNYVYPTVAVAEKPLVAYMGSDVEQRKRNLREERKRDYEQHKSQQKVKHPDRRHEFVDTASGPYGGLFQGLGDHGNRSEALNKERQREYNEQHAGKEKISGRPNWARDTLPNNTDRGRSSPMKSQPPTDQYQQMLDEKRREEASRRRYDDPEYQGRLAESRERERGEAGPRYGGY